MADLVFDSALANANNQAIASIPEASRQGALAGFQLGQQGAVRSALNHYDPNDKTGQSANDTINALTKAGATDQATALANLQYARALNSGAIQGIQGLSQALGGAQGASQAQATQPQQPAQSPADTEKLRQEGGWAVSQLHSLRSIPDKGDRLLAYQDIRDQGIKKGYDPSTIDAVAGDLSNAQIDDHIGNVQAWLDHASFGGPNQGPPPGQHPDTSPSQNQGVTPPNFLSNPQIQQSLALLAAKGINIEPLVNSLKATQGYTGALAPNQVAVYGGQPGFRAPNAPQSLSPGQQLVSGETGQPLGGQVPFKIEPQVLSPGQVVQTVNPNPGAAGAGVSGPAAASANAPSAAIPTPQGLSQALGGQIHVTSGLRTPEHNAEVGGVPNSKHLTGNALDFLPPQGVSLAQATAGAKAAYPNARVLNEGDHIHIQWSGQHPQANAGTPGLAPGVSGPTPPPLFGAPQHVAGVSGLVQQSATGKVEPVSNSGITPESVRSQSMQAYKDVQPSLTAWQTLKNAAPTMTGPSALLLMDSLLRSANPGAVARQSTIEYLGKEFGLGNELLGRLSGTIGHGTLTESMRQQILDAAHSVVTAHYDTAAGVNRQAIQFAKRNGQNPDDLVAPIGQRPNHFYIQLPPISQRLTGQIYEGPKGAALWSGNHWEKVGG